MVYENLSMMHSISGAHDKLLASDASSLRYAQKLLIYRLVYSGKNLLSQTMPASEAVSKLVVSLTNYYDQRINCETQLERSPSIACMLRSMIRGLGQAKCKAQSGSRVACDNVSHWAMYRVSAKPTVEISFAAKCFSCMRQLQANG